MELGTSIKIGILLIRKEKMPIRIIFDIMIKDQQDNEMSTVRARSTDVCVPQPKVGRGLSGPTDRVMELRGGKAKVAAK